MSDSLVDQVEVTRASVAKKLILRHLMELYNYDFSEFDKSDTNEFGLFRYDYLDRKWQCATPVTDLLLASSGLSVVFGWHRLPPPRLLV